ncbi:MAG: hypothetical protein BWY99_02715 [Synergistetes bacterium ADurb.BinA166]|nr:MAG: hypothetical protein BWY99_02715 [Synergistetes bacterium ADurb.BinA166]
MRSFGSAKTSFTTSLWMAFRSASRGSSPFLLVSHVFSWTVRSLYPSSVFRTNCARSSSFIASSVSRTSDGEETEGCSTAAMFRTVLGRSFTDSRRATAFAAASARGLAARRPATAFSSFVVSEGTRFPASSSS